MPLNGKRIGKLAVASGAMAVALILALTLPAPAAKAQTNQGDQRPDAVAQPAPETVQTIFLKNVAEQNDLNDMMTDLRNILPRAKIYGLQSQNAITLKGTPEDLNTASKLIADLDRPRPLYRLTYTITDYDGGKRTGSQSFVIMAVLEQRSIFKQGNRVPIVTGSYDTQARNSNTQVQYQDVGLSIDATVDGSPDGLTLRTKIEQSSLPGDRTATAAQDPVVHQIVLQEAAQLAEGKPLVLGSLDVPGTTQRQEIAVTAELVH
jgi:type II secretory pathway component GspD/PulD (secretin)